MFDVLIIGAGIVGCFLAHDLSKRECNIAVFDKNSDVAEGASMANSAVIHSGHDPKAGTLKAKLNLRGNVMYEKVCEELQIKFKRTSAFVAAVDSEEIKTLQELYERTQTRRIPSRLLSGNDARKKERNLSDRVVKVLELPTTGIVSPWGVAIALMEEAVINGTDLHLEETVIGIQKQVSGTDPKTEYFQIQTDKGVYQSRYVINAAGVYADDVYQMVLGEGKKKPFTITPRRGQYFVLDRLRQPLVERVIYPVPGPKGKGVLVVPTVGGNILLGPDAEYVQGKESIDTTLASLEYVKENVGKTVKNIPFDKVIRTFAGLRPTGDAGDFVIGESSSVRGFVNAACMESPGLAAAPAISEYIIDVVMRHQFAFREKENYIRRKKQIILKELSVDEKNELLKVNPAFGQIVCRCEQITKGEILDAIHRPVGARTVKGVKKRIRPGMGRCQGGFCEPEVVKILAQEFGISMTDVRLSSRESYLLCEETKKI